MLRQKPALCSGFATDTTHQPVAFSTLPLHTGGDKRGMPWTPRILRCVHGNACGAGRTATDAVPLNRRVAKDFLLDAHSGYDMLVEPAFDGVAKAAREPPDWLAPTLSRTWALGLVPQGWLGGGSAEDLGVVGACAVGVAPSVARLGMTSGSPGR